MGKYVCGACGAEHAQKPETDVGRLPSGQRILRDPPGTDNLETVVRKADISAIKGVLKRHGIIDAYTILFEACTDEQIAMLLQHQMRFFNALVAAEEEKYSKEIRGGGTIPLIVPTRES